MVVHEYGEVGRPLLVLLAHGLANITLAYGASLGAAVAYRLFLDPAFTVAHAWLDGTALCESAAFAEWFTKRLFKSRKKTLERRKKQTSIRLQRAAVNKRRSAWMPNAELTIRSRCPHCGYMAAHPKKYVAEIEQFIGNVGSNN